MMLDDDIVAVSLSSVWRVLSQAGLLLKWNGKPPKKGTSFAQTLAAHHHWHADISCLNISGQVLYPEGRPRTLRRGVHSAGHAAIAR